MKDRIDLVLIDRTAQRREVLQFSPHEHGLVRQLSCHVLAFRYPIPDEADDASSAAYKLFHQPGSKKATASSFMDYVSVSKSSLLNAG